jgi:hypothetical protein
MSGLIASQVYVKAVAEVRNAAVDFSPLLASTETITSTTVTDPSSGLTISSISVSTGGLTINGSTVAAGQALLFTVSGGSSGTTYYVYAGCVTSLSQTIYRHLPLRVRGNSAP